MRLTPKFQFIYKFGYNFTILILLKQIRTTAYFINQNIYDYSLTDDSIFIFNTKQFNILNTLFENKEFDIEKVKKELVDLYKKDRNKFSKIKFVHDKTSKKNIIKIEMKREDLKKVRISGNGIEFNNLLSLITFLESNKGVIIAGDFVDERIFVGEEKLIYGGCRKVYKFGKYFFCWCDSGCGLFCENKKNVFLANVLLLFCILLLLIRKKKNVEVKRNVNANIEKKEKRA